MLKLDNSLLDELGLGALPEDQKKAMLQHIYETLELRVGTNLANQMTDQQLEEFERFIDDGGDANQAQALQWLESNLPNYKQVVNQVFEELKSEIKSMSAQIMASSAQPPAPQPVVVTAPAAQPQPAPQAMQQHEVQQTQTVPMSPPMPQPVAPQPQGAPAPVPMDYGAQQQVPIPQAYPQRQPLPPQMPDGYQFPQQQPPAGPGI